MDPPLPNSNLETEDNPNETSTLINQQPTEEEMNVITKLLAEIKEQVDNSRSTILYLLSAGHSVGFLTGFLFSFGIMFNGLRPILFLTIGSLCSILCLATSFGIWYYRRQKKAEIEKCIWDAAKIDKAAVLGELHKHIFGDDFRVIIETIISVFLLLLRAFCMLVLALIPLLYLNHHWIGDVLIGFTVVGCALDGDRAITSGIALYRSRNNPHSRAGGRMHLVTNLLRGRAQKHQVGKRALTFVGRSVKRVRKFRTPIANNEVKRIKKKIILLHHSFIMNKILPQKQKFIDIIEAFNKTLENNGSWKKFLFLSIQKMESGEVERNVNITEECIFTALSFILPNVLKVISKAKNVSGAVKKTKSLSTDSKIMWLEFLYLNLSCFFADKNREQAGRSTEIRQNNQNFDEPR